MPQNSVTSIVQTRDGYLWLGTFGGLARFDGVRFKIFDISNTEALTSNRILSLLEDRSGNLWIGTQGGGVVRLRDGLFTSYSDQDNAPSGEVRAIVEDRDGVVWFGAEKLVKYASGRFESAGPDEWITPVKWVWSLLVDREQSLWVATTGGLGRFRDGVWRVFGMADGLIRHDVRFMHEDSRGLLWVRTGGRLFHLYGDKFVEVLVQGEQPGRIFAAALDGGGNCWVGSDRGLFHVRAVGEQGHGSSARTLFHRAIERAAAGGVRALLEDREGNIWVGTDGDGLLRLRAAPFKPFKSPMGMIVSSNVESLAGDGGGGLWIACSPKKIGRLKDDDWWELPADNEIRDIRAISSSSDGTLWIQHHGLTRLSKYRDGQFTHLGREFDPIKGVLVDRQGTVWISSAGGLSSIRDGRIETITVADGLPSMGGVGVLSDSRDGTIWIGADGALTRYRNGDFKQYTSADGLPRGRVRSIHEGSDGNLWITTYGGGMARLRDGKFTRYTTLEGLPDNSLGKILEDDTGNLWINSNRGVFRVSLDALNGFADDRLSQINCRTFRTGEAGGQSGVRTADGSLWFPTIDGLIAIDPGMVAGNDVPPPIVVEWARVFGKSFDPSDRIRLPIDRSDRIELPMDRRDVVIKYTGLSFVDPDNVTFRYRLIGYNEDWVDAGTRRRAAYQRIPPGTYEFQVQARNNHHVWSEHAATLGITVPAHFYETAWFLVLCGFAGTATLFVGHRVRTQNVRRRNAELRAEISDRKDAERARDHERSLLHALMDYMPDNIYFKDTQSRFTRINQAMAEYFGLDSPAVAIGKNDGDFFAEEHARPAYEDEQQVMRSGQSLVAKEEREVWPDGRTTWVSTTKVPLRSDDGQILGTFGISRDITERKRAEEALQLANAEMELVFQALPDLYFRMDARGTILDYRANRSSDLYLPPEEFLGRRMQDVIPPVVGRLFEKGIAQVLTHGGTTTFEYPLSKTEQQGHYEGRLVRLGDDQVIAVVRDVTQRRQAEEALRESEERYRSLLDDALDSTKVGLFILDAKFQIVWLNQAIERSFSLRREDVIGKDKRQLIGERIRGIFEDPETFSDKVLATYDNNTYVENFECHVLPDGEREERWLEHWSHPIRSGLYAGGRIEHYYDITDRKRAEDALRESERRLRSVLDGFFEAPIGLCFLDRELRYVFINEWLAKLNGTTVEGHLGRTIGEVLPDVAAGAELQLRRVLETGEPNIDGIVEAETPADPGRKHVFQHNYYPVKAGDGTVIGVSCAVQDFTERKRADEQIRKQQHQLEHLSRIGTMGEMATGFAHELNQPLASIVNYTKGCVRRIQAGRPDPQELVAALNDASSEAERAGEIIKRIRRFVRKREPARTTIDIAELIGQVLDLMRSDLQQQSIQTRLEVEEHMLTLQGDRIQLQQVLVNLLRNSIEAMKGTEMEHRRLTVGAATNNGDSVTLFVRDTGCGLGEVDPDSIFEPFYTTKEDGTGMGLAISRTIIEAHGGSLMATDNADGGCTFHFSLPQHTELTGV